MFSLLLFSLVFPLIEFQINKHTDTYTYIIYTARNLYTRTQEHVNNKDNESFMNKHKICMNTMKAKRECENIRVAVYAYKLVSPFE